MFSPEDNTTVVRMMGEFENYIQRDMGKSALLGKEVNNQHLFW